MLAQAGILLLLDGSWTPAVAGVTDFLGLLNRLLLPALYHGRGQMDFSDAPVSGEPCAREVDTILEYADL